MKKLDELVDVNVEDMIKKYNRAIDDAKMGFEITFPELYGTVVCAYCIFRGNDTKKNRRNALVTDIVNTANNRRYLDIDEKGENVNHFWLQGVYNDCNPQRSVWDMLQFGDELYITGTLDFYGVPRKKTISNPWILRVTRDGKILYG